jgi:hypothetical protein
MVASNYHTQRATEFYAAIRNDPEKQAGFKEAMLKIINETGRQFNEEEVGKLLCAGLADSLCASVEKVPPIAQEMLAHVFMHDIDWRHVARQFVTDETLN